MQEAMSTTRLLYRAAATFFSLLCSCQVSWRMTDRFVMGPFTARQNQCVDVERGDLHTARKSTCDKIYPAVWLRLRPPLFFPDLLSSSRPNISHHCNPAGFTSPLRTIATPLSASTASPWNSPVATMADSELQVSQPCAWMGQRPTAAMPTIRVANPLHRNACATTRTRLTA